MELTHIDIRNFKCLKHFSSDLSPITLITGANSSGKSSVIYSILSIIQSRTFPQSWELNGDLISLGDYWEVVNNHNTSNDIELGIHLKEGEIATEIQSQFSISPAGKQAHLKKFLAKNPFVDISFTRDSKLRMRVKYDPAKDPESKHYNSDIFKNIAKIFAETADPNDKSAAAREKSIQSIIENPLRAREFLVEAKSLKELERKVSEDFLLASKMEDIGNTSRNMHRWFNYVGPFRYAPDRTYYRRARRDLRVGTCGENYIDQLLHWHEQETEKYKKLESALDKVGLGKKLRFKKMAGGRFEVRVRARAASPSSNLADVGLGVSQFLPLLVADFQLRKGATMLIAQPEIHLHPSAQAEYAHILCENAQSLGRRYIIETHSEYLINRLRLLIAKGELAEKSVKIIHLSPEKSTSKAHEIKLLKNGRIEGAPGEFFETYQMDVLDLAVTAASGA